MLAPLSAGAVGCYYGGMLARAGREVALIAPPQHVEAITRDGLRMQTKAFDEHGRLVASSEPSAVQDAKLVLANLKHARKLTRPADLVTHQRPMQTMPLLSHFFTDSSQDVHE